MTGKRVMDHQDFHLFGLTIVGKGAAVHDVHTMMVLGFQKKLVAIFYMIAPVTTPPASTSVRLRERLQSLVPHAPAAGAAS
ncbi:MAG: hypothetical protein IPN03_15665 [Holophagales bacterium]|nr:hypothetical protein [Holophagales bacterium]